MTVYGARNGNWSGSKLLSYEGAHGRVKRKFGRARDYDCNSCGGPASEWAYQHGCPDERICARIGFPYCPHPEHYKPMCRSCHRKMDVTDVTRELLRTAKISNPVPKGADGRFQSVGEN